MRKAIVTLVALAVLGGGVYGYYNYRKSGPAPTVATAQVTRGDVVDTVGATGTLQAVTTVQVGTQVSGTIQALYADFNSLVRKGQVLARLDPSLFQTQIEQARANLIRAQADLERLQVSLDDAKTKLARAQELSGRSLIPKSDLETAQVNVRSIEAQIRSSEAQVTQAQASLNQNQVNLQHTVIEAPIDGLVISRSVDVGQTVAASMQAPTLFILAADLTKMQVLANLDESDVGRIRPGQHVSFRVDAYPSDDFAGTVSQVRLEPKVQQNVVTYATVIDVPNNDLKLKPGMTANVTIEIARSSNVLRVPNAALRFRPTNEIFAALGQTPPDPSQLRGELAGGGGMGRGAAAPANTPGATGSGPPGSNGPAAANQPQASAQAHGNDGESGTAQSSENPRRRRNDAASTETGNAAATGREGAAGSGGERFGGGGRFAERMQNMPPEERERFIARMRERGIDPTAGGRGTGPGGRGAEGGRDAAGRGRASNTPGENGAPVDAARTGRGEATTIDALFGPLPRTESVGRVWLYVNKQLRPVRLRLGISDGQNTELIEGDLHEGAEVVTNVATGTEAARPAASSFPFGQPGRGGFPGGGFPGGGNRGGGRGRGQ